MTRTHIPVESGLFGPAMEKPPRPKYTGIIQTAKIIVAEEGIRSLYLGLSTSLIRQVPAGAISLWMYEIICARIAANGA
ncbi:hypothetical protein HDU67_000704 [Dinochytrium kinnereticum]|nr:hypothetical protein HDU67_000704 [Dinochytrium kinnereticum]